MKMHRLLAAIFACVLLAGCQKISGSASPQSAPTSSYLESTINQEGEDISSERVLEHSQNISQSGLDELAQAAGDVVPEYSDTVVFSLENGDLLADGEVVPHNVTKLDLNGAIFPDYGFLASFTELDDLNLSNSSITDLSSLSGLSKLTKLQLADTQITDIAPLGGLSQLWWLDISNCPVDPDLTILSCQDTLNVLYLYATPITDLTGLDKLCNLRELWCWNIQVSDFSALSELADLEVLYISQTKFDDLALLKDLKKLRCLDISFTNVQDYTSLAENTFASLSVLSLSVPAEQAADVQSMRPSLTIQNYYEE